MVLVDSLIYSLSMLCKTLYDIYRSGIRVVRFVDV